MRAQNNVGMSNVFSPVLKVTASATYSPQLCARNPRSLVICWSSAYYPGSLATGSVPTNYQLEWFNPSPSNGCDTASATALSNTNNPTTTGYVGQWVAINPTNMNNVFQVNHTLSIQTPGVFPNNVFPSFSEQCYRVRIFVTQATSSIDYVWAVGVPQGMNQPYLISLFPYNATIAWGELNTTVNGGDMPIMYWLEWYNYYTLAWTTLNTASQGLIY